MVNNSSHGGFISPCEMISSFLKGNNMGGIAPSGMPNAILVAYSGGADSACLLHFLVEWCAENGVELFAAHVNHGIRGDEALRDRDHCVRECERLGIKIFILDADVPKIAAESGKSLESAARDVRYEFFAQIMGEQNISVLATAHNSDDNLETVIFRLARGSGARGLCGIPAVRELEGGGIVIRPLLNLSKKEILDICAEKGIEYVYDSTNSDTAYSRNSIRATVLPVLRTINPEAGAAATRACEFLREDCDFIDSIADEYMNEYDFDSVEKLAMLEKPIFMRVVLRMYEKCTSAMPEFVHLNGILKLVKGRKEQSSVSLPGRIKAKIEGGRLIFCPDTREKIISAEQPKTELVEGDNYLQSGYILRLESDFSTKSSQSTLQIQRSGENIYKLFTHVCVQSDKINGRLFIRGRLPGDKIRFGGMSRDVRKLFSERAVPPDERTAYPIVCDDDGVVWIPNIALRDGAEIKEKNSPRGVRLTLLRTSLKG